MLVVDDLSTGERDERSGRRRVRAAGHRRRRRRSKARSRAARTSSAISRRRRASRSRSPIPLRDCSRMCGDAERLRGGARRGAPVVFASTGGALYGDAAPRPTPESFAPQPLSPYGASKLAGEAYVATWAPPLRPAERRAAPGQRLRAAPESARRGRRGRDLRRPPARGEQPQLRGEGKPTRDYVYVTDVANAFVAAADAGRAGTYNVGTGRETSTSRVLELLQDAAGTAIEPKHTELQAGELQASALDGSRDRARPRVAPHGRARGRAPEDARLVPRCRRGRLIRLGSARAFPRTSRPARSSLRPLCRPAAPRKLSLCA